MPERKSSRKKSDASQGIGPVFIAKAGAKGACSVCLIFFGIVLVGIGGTLFAAGNTRSDSVKNDKPKRLDDPYFKDAFARGESAFESIHRPLQVTGPILIGVGAFMVIGAVILCVCIARKGPSPPRNTMVAGPQLDGQAETSAKQSQVKAHPHHLPPDCTAGTSRRTARQPEVSLLLPNSHNHHPAALQHLQQYQNDPVTIQLPTRVPPRSRPNPTYIKLTSVPEE